MQRNWVMWVFLAFLAWHVTHVVTKALSVPWSWTFDQVIAVVWLCMLLGVAGRYAWVWWRSGIDGVKANWAMSQRTFSQGVSMQDRLFQRVGWKAGRCLAVGIGLIVMSFAWLVGGFVAELNQDAVSIVAVLLLALGIAALMLAVLIKLAGPPPPPRTGGP